MATEAAPAVSVVIPTVRQRFLAATLDSLARQRAAPPFEVLVVENGRRGAATESLVAAHAHAAAPMRYHFLARPGANPARNAGIELARGAIIALTDDDCIVADDWIAAIQRAHDAFPGAACIGGAVDLDFLVAPPPWLVGVFRLMLAGIDWPREAADGDGPTTDLTRLVDRYLVSANLSFRRTVCARIGGFCEDLVPPDQESRNDEALFLDGARALGAPGLLFDRRIRVRHQIPAERTTPEYFERKFRALAVAVVAYHRRARLYAGAIPPYSSEAEALRNTLLQHEMATGVAERQIAEARAILGADTAARRQFVSHLLRCRIAWLAALQAGIDRGE